MRRLPLAHEARGDAESRQPHLAGRVVEQNVGRLDVFMDEAAPVKLADSRGNSDGEAQEASDLHRHAEQPVNRLTALIFEHQYCLTGVAYEVQWAQRPRPVQFVL